MVCPLVPKDLAAALTMIDQVLLKAIPAKELVKKAYMQAEKSPNMAAMIVHFNNISSWVASLVIVEPNLHKRVQLVSQFINAAWVHPSLSLNIITRLVSN